LVYILFCRFRIFLLFHSVFIMLYTGHIGTGFCSEHQKHIQFIWGYYVMAKNNHQKVSCPNAHHLYPPNQQRKVYWYQKGSKARREPHHGGKDYKYSYQILLTAQIWQPDGAILEHSRQRYNKAYSSYDLGMTECHYKEKTASVGIPRDSGGSQGR
jgi:hypothetical protein